MAASFPARPVNYKAIECFAAIREWLLPLLISLISRDQIEPVLDLIETRSQMSKNKPRQSDVMNKIGDLQILCLKNKAHVSKDKRSENGSVIHYLMEEFCVFGSSSSLVPHKPHPSNPRKLG